jgi:type I restriction enzyme, S subunit
MSLPERSLGEVLHLDIRDETVRAGRDYPIAGVYGFGRGLFQRGPIRSDETSYPKLNRLTAGQLVMSRLKAFEGAMAVIPEDYDGWYLSPEFPTFAIDADKADDRYIANLCGWPEFWTRLGAQSKGVGARKVRVSAERLLTIKVPLPDLNEQHRIAVRLDAMLDKHSLTRELQARRTKLKTAIKESLMNSAISGASKSLPVKQVMTLTRRQVFPGPSNTYREVGIRSFGRGIFHKDPVTAEEIGDKRIFAIEPGDLIFSNVFAWEGAVAQASDAESGMVGSHRFMTYVVADSVGDIAYLKHYFTSSHGLDVIRRASPGSAGRNKTLGIKTFEEQMIPVPDIKTQQRVGRTLDGIDTNLMVDDLNVLDALKLSLLNAAFSGQF